MRKTLFLLSLLLAAGANANSNANAQKEQSRTAQEPAGQSTLVARWTAQWYGSSTAIDSLETFDWQPSVRLDGLRATFMALFPRKTEGSTYRFTGHIKTALTEGVCMVMLGEYSTPGTSGFIHSKTIEFSGTNEWQSFEVEVPIVEQVNYCRPAVTINGEGHVWLTELQVFIDGKLLPQEGTRKPGVIDYPAKRDTMPQSGFAPTTKPTRHQIDALMAACKAWGEVKYRNHAVARGEHNIDAELFRLLPRVWSGEPQAVERWCKEFGAPAEELPIWHYYFGSAFDCGPFVSRNEIDYQTLDAGVKLLGVFRLWNAVRYFSPNLDLADDQEQVLRTAIANVFSEDYEKTLKMMAWAMHDSHVRISSGRIDSTMLGAPFQTQKFLDGKFVVTDVWSDAVPLRVGDAITHINGKSARQYIKENEWRLSASNPAVTARNMGSILPFTHTNAPLQLRFERGGKRMQADVPVLPLGEYEKVVTASHNARPEKPLFYTIGNDILLVHMWDFDEKTPLPPVDDYDKVIIDMRSYPSGETELLAKLMTSPVAFARFTRPNLLRPGEFVELSGSCYPATSTCPDRRIVLLVDESTQSHAEFVSMWLQNNPNVITLGTQTSGADGNSTAIPLPGGFHMSFTGLGCLYPDGTNTQGVGIRINEVLPRTISSVAAGTDNLIDRAVEILE